MFLIAPKLEHGLASTPPRKTWDAITNPCPDLTYIKVQQKGSQGSHMLPWINFNPKTDT